MEKDSDIALLQQWNGFRNSAFLFTQFPLPEIENYQFKPFEIEISKLNIPKSMRLGNRVEQFIFESLHQNSAIEWWESNIQIFEDKITLGELDCVFFENNTFVHLEIVYKFYLYDENEGNSPLGHWIGPNRKDSLVQKLEKLQQKQFPLLFHHKVKEHFENRQLDFENIQQKTIFKAQLFVPFQKEIEILTPVNPECIKGFYIHYEALFRLKENSFYVPSKVNWLSDPRLDVSWCDYETFLVKIEKDITTQKSPLCWMKTPEGKLESFFVIWWNY